MAHKDRRAAATVRKGQLATSGRMTVAYRGLKGKTRSALVVGKGTVSGLKLKLSDRRVIDNVPAMTARNQTNVYKSLL